MASNCGALGKEASKKAAGNEGTFLTLLSELVAPFSVTSILTAVKLL